MAIEIIISMSKKAETLASKTTIIVANFLFVVFEILDT
jgi:hypothetical protein